jgi:TRAP-type C4-dicarboxylate transport system substrate-binding protein
VQIIELAMATATTADTFANADEVEPTIYVFDLPFVGADREVAFTAMLTDAQRKADELKTGLSATELLRVTAMSNLQGARELTAVTPGALPNGAATATATATD